MSPYPTARAESQSNTPAHVRKPCTDYFMATGLALYILQLNVKGLSAAKHLIIHILAE